MSDFLFWAYYVLAWAIALAICWLVVIGVKTILLQAQEAWKNKNFRSKVKIFFGTILDSVSVIVFFGFMIVACLVSSRVIAPPEIYLPGGSTWIISSRSPGYVYEYPGANAPPYCYLNQVTHAYWVENTGSLVLNDIAPSEYDTDILNTEVDVKYLFQYSGYYAEVQAFGARPFTVELAREFELLPFERADWQFNPLDRRDDDRRHREYRRQFRELPSRQRDAIAEDINTELIAYLASTSFPLCTEAQSYLEDHLNSWFIETIVVIPKTNNW